MRCCAPASRGTGRWCDLRSCRVGKGASALCPPTSHAKRSGGHASLCPPCESASTMEIGQRQNDIGQYDEAGQSGQHDDICNLAAHVGISENSSLGQRAATALVAI